MTNATRIHIIDRTVFENESVTTVIEGTAMSIPYFPSDPTSDQLMRIVEASGSLDFWDDPREDIYTLEDGDPV